LRVAGEAESIVGMTRNHVFDIVHIILDFWLIGALGFLIFSSADKRPAKKKVLWAMVVPGLLVMLALFVFHR
jgi:hypothetical protein